MKGKLREALGDSKLKLRFVEKKKGLPKKKAAKDGVVSILIDFPAVLEHDLAQTVTAIVQAATLGGFQPADTIDFKTVCRLLNNEVGNDHFEEDWEAMYPDYDAQVGDGTGKPEQDVANPTPGATPPPGHIPAPSFGAESARMVKMLVEALKRMEREGKLR